MATIKTIHIFSLLIFLIILNSTANGAGNVLYGGQTLEAGQSITYNNYALKCQDHCNLVLYEDSEAIWSSNVAQNKSGCHCTMQVDGNLVVYTSDKVVVWCSESWGGDKPDDYVLILQEDRDVAIYRTKRWSTKTTKSQSLVQIRGEGSSEE